MNKVILMGRLTRDPEVRYGQGEDKSIVARYTLAVDRRIRAENGPSADFISCVTFGKNAEFAEKYLRRGVKIVAAGRIQTGSYTNREGNKAYTTDVVVEEQEFAESKAASGQQVGRAAAGGWEGGHGGAYANRSPQPMASADGFVDIPEGIEEEVPFL